MWTTSRVRQHFLDYFATHNHTIVPSSTLVPGNDPTLLFTNAGMVQFKNYFTGSEKPSFNRAASAQKCVRAGGKHNDLENVGYTARHHTFFEMLGNFSFGDYFKEQAIELAWTLLTREFRLSPDRLLVTVYAEDEEAAVLWRKISGFPDSKIIRISSNDNFWAMGDTGPCGPCSEIFYDHGEHIAGGPPGTPEENGDRFVEIWNLVFMQYEQLSEPDPQGLLRTSLPKPCIDTGSGLERLTAVLQGVHNNYEIDLFQNLIKASAELTKSRAEGKALVSHRVIVDHLRASCFLLADGVSPSNEGRGYVLRRIMRRAMRHAYMLGCKKPLMHELVNPLIQEMGEHYSELGRAQAYMVETLMQEEMRFRETLGRGLKLLSDETEKLSHDASLPGETAFKLYDTYGFPLDLTQDILRGENRTVDVEGFNAAMARQKTEARAHWVGSGETQEEKIWFQLAEKIPATEFLGYTSNQAEGRILACIRNQATCDYLGTGQEGYIVTSKTPFYAESGGQMGDTGIIRNEAGCEAEVLDTFRKAGHLFVHHIRVLKGELKSGETVLLEVNLKRRQSLRANHSATHLLHASLRKLLGKQVTQKGSLVAPERLRFDFSFNNALTLQQIEAIETEVNNLIRRNSGIQTLLMNPEEAIKTGAIALFGEKYGDEVRVVKMGIDDMLDIHSIEFCGGTHVNHTGDIGLFKIVSESGVAAGIRRIEALTGAHAEAYIRQKEHLLQQLNTHLKTTDEQLFSRIQQIVEEKKNLERDYKDLQRKVALGGKEQSELAPKNVGGISFITRTLQDIPARELKSIADQMKQQIGQGVIAIAGLSEGKVSLVVGVTDNLIPRINAVELVKIGATVLGGSGGGGRPDMAQAGGTSGEALPAAFQAIEQALKP